MADEEEQGATSQADFGLAPNPFVPMYDPLAYAKVGSNPEFGGVPGVRVAGAQPAPVYMPGTANVPPLPPRRGGGETPNQLQPTQLSAPDQSNLLGGGQLGGLQQLLQLKGLEDLAAPATGVTYTPGGAVARPGAGAGPGRVPTGAVIAAAARPYQDMVNDAAKQNNVNPDTLTRLLYRESQFDPKAKSPAGAQGIGQFMPATARNEGVDVNDPKSSIYGSAKYLRKMTDMFNGNEQLGMAAYNWGPGNVQKWLQGGMKGNVPQETLDYVNAISGRPLAPPANVPSAAAGAMAAMTGGAGGGFEVPPGRAAPAPTFGVAPKVGDMSPHGGPYVSSGGKLYATDREGKIIGQPVGGGMTYPTFDPNKTEDKNMAMTERYRILPDEAHSPSLVSEPPVGNDQGTPNLGGGVSRPAINPDMIAPGATPGEVNKPAPEAQPVAAQPPSQSGLLNDPAMKKLWQFMLIKSLFPQLQFRNVGYDPWAVHRFGQGGGY